MPGCGKTYLSAYIIEIPLRSKQAIAYFFCDTKDERKRSTVAILETWIWQLLQADPRPKQRIKVAEFYDKGNPTSRDDLLATLRLLINKDPETDSQEIAKDGPQFFFVLDGLDECHDVIRKDLLDICQELAESAKVLIVSRRERDIEAAIEKVTYLQHLHITAAENGSDIQRYIHDQVKSLDLEDNRLGVQIEQRLSEESDGMFLWVRLMIKELLDQTTMTEMKEALDNLPVGLDQFYGRILDNINSYPRNWKIKALRALQWIVCAVRPLTISELEIALAIEISQLDYDPWNRLQKPRDLIFKLCGPLIELDKSSDTIRIVHASVKDFLFSRHEQDSSFSWLLVNQEKAHSLIAQSCLTYLSYGNIDYAAVDSDLKSSLKFLDEFVQNYKLLAYSSMYWFEHVHSSSANADLNASMKRFLSYQNTSVRWLQIFHRLCGDRGNFGSSSSIGVHDRLRDLSCPKSQDLPEFHVWIDHISTPSGPAFRWRIFLNSGHYEYYLPIQIAAFFDFEEVVQSEADRLESINDMNHLHTTALHTAAMGDAVGAAELLLKAGADMEIESVCAEGIAFIFSFGQFNLAPAMVASVGANLENLFHGGRITPARVMNEAGVNEGFVMENIIPNMLAHGPGSTLEWRNWRGFVAAIDGAPNNLSDRIAVLLKQEYLAKDKSLGRPRTPLSKALCGGNVSVTSLLIQAGADVNAVFPEDKTSPLHDAVRFCPSAIKLLLKSGAHPNVQDFHGNMPIHYAAYKNLSTEVDMLITAGSDIEKRNLSGKTPILAAAENAARKATHVLLKAGATSDTLSRTTGSEDGPRTPPDILKTYLILKYCFRNNKAPPTLIYRILSLAQYWIRTSVVRQDIVLVSETYNLSAYLTTPPIPVSPSSSPVQKVVFTIGSHDQGWADNDRSSGTWTWFFAGIERKNRPGHLNIGPRIVVNRHATWEVATHTVTWSSDPKNREGEGEAGWVKSLRGADRVCVAPFARFPAWVNYVNSVKIDLYSTVLESPHPL